MRYDFPVQEDHTAFSLADAFSDFVVHNTLVIVDCWNLLNKFLSKSGMVIVYLPRENPGSWFMFPGSLLKFALCFGFSYMTFSSKNEVVIGALSRIVNVSILLSYIGGQQEHSHQSVFPTTLMASLEFFSRLPASSSHDQGLRPQGEALKCYYHLDIVLLLPMNLFFR